MAKIEYLPFSSSPQGLITQCLREVQEGNVERMFVVLIGDDKVMTGWSSGTNRAYQLGMLEELKYDLLSRVEN